MQKNVEKRIGKLITYFWITEFLEGKKEKKTVALRQISVVTQDISHFQKIKKIDCISFR